MQQRLLSCFCRHEMMMVLFLITSLGKKLIFPSFFFIWGEVFRKRTFIIILWQLLGIAYHSNTKVSGTLNWLPHAGAPSIELSSSVDVTSGGEVCPNISVEFTCIGTEVAFLSWFRNGVKIEDFSSDDSIGMIVVAPYTLFLDTINRTETSVLANFISRLAVNLSDLMSGDNISCSQLHVQKSNILSYTVRGNKRPII